MEIAAYILAAITGAAAVFFYTRWKAVDGQIAPLNEELVKLRPGAEQLNLARQRLAVMEAEMRLLNEQYQNQLPAQFENLAAKILEDNSKKLSETSEKNIGQMLNPLKEKLAEFQKKVEDTYNNETVERRTLKNEIASIVATHEKMRTETANLTNALKGNNKVQGNWGEHVLAMLLESCGLREGTEFTTQGRDMKLRNAEDARLQPDIIINLPDAKHLIIDSKVSLLHYEQVVNTEDAAARDAALALFLNSVRSHVRGLAEKDYSAAEGLGTPDFVLMFLPIEGAHALALQSDAGLFPFAWDKKVVLVSPTTLMPILKTVASLWKIERQNKNTLEIVRQGGNLYDKFVIFVENMQEIGASLSKTNATYEKAMGQLSTGHGNLIARAESLRKLGAKNTKSLPEKLVAEAKEARQLEEVS